MAKGNEPAVSRFTKEQVLGSRTYANMRDLLAALLAEGGRYSHEEIEALVSGFMVGGVKK